MWHNISHVTPHGDSDFSSVFSSLITSELIVVHAFRRWSGTVQCSAEPNKQQAGLRLNSWLAMTYWQYNWQFDICSSMWNEMCMVKQRARFYTVPCLVSTLFRPRPTLHTPLARTENWTLSCQRLVVWARYNKWLTDVLWLCWMRSNMTIRKRWPGKHNLSFNLNGRISFVWCYRTTARFNQLDMQSDCGCLSSPLYRPVLMPSIQQGQTNASNK